RVTRADWPGPVTRTGTCTVALAPGGSEASAHRPVVIAPTPNAHPDGRPLTNEPPSAARLSTSAPVAREVPLTRVTCTCSSATDQVTDPMVGTAATWRSGSAGRDGDGDPADADADA